LDGFDSSTFNVPESFHPKIALYLRTVRGAWGAFCDRHGDPQKVAQNNRPEEWALHELTKLRRLEKIPLWALALAASFAEGLAAPKERPVRVREPRVVTPEQRTDRSTWRLSFARPPRTGARCVCDMPGKPPPRERDVMRMLARKLETLRRVVFAPERAAMVIARRACSAAICTPAGSRPSAGPARAAATGAATWRASGNSPTARSDICRGR